jgi:hypothetical protein
MRCTPALAWRKVFVLAHVDELVDSSDKVREHMSEKRIKRH